MSVSSSATVISSRSPSPLTPEAFDNLDPVAIHSDLDLANPWGLSAMHPTKPTDIQLPWDMDPSEFITPRKAEDDEMLRLDDLIEQHAYDDSPAPIFSPSLGYPSLKTGLANTTTPSSHPVPDSGSSFGSNSFVSSRNTLISSTKPIPPPASLPRKQDPSLVHQRVVHPPKESCYNLPIIFPSIPEGGTKSRVETQVRVTVDLADTSSSSDPSKYDRVGSWKWLQLPPGTATKRRTRKQGKIDPDPQDILHLSATVTCASPPHNPVLSCSSCQTREAKRVAKKLAARVRPARSDTDSCDEKSPNRPPKSRQTEDTTSIIQFNCAEVLDFSTGSVVLPLRITCYCRHHREKVGFNVHFTMTDDAGRIVGTGSSRPIMITDDHKTAPPASNMTRQSEISNNLTAMDSEWVGGAQNEVSPDTRAPSKRGASTLGSKKRPKPYDSANKPNREGSVASLVSPSTSYSTLPTRSPTPSSIFQQILASESLQQPPHLQHSSYGSDSSSTEALITPLDRSPNVQMPDSQQQHEIMHAPSPLSLPKSVSSAVMPTHPHPMPFMFFDPSQTPQNLSLQFPTIHRLIPNMGPTHGGIEVTVLGANFHPSLQLNCIFGDVAASSTQRWSDNALVCVLPPRASAGVVAVWFDGFPKIEDQNTPPSLFTYSDESDRALMELALQVVGLKMTGKIEDAKNVAMRIVGGSDGSDSQHGNNSNNMMQLASSTFSTRDLRPILFRAGENDDFENLIIDFLTILDTPLDHRAPNSISTIDAISHPTSSGQTLLHLAAFLGFSRLADFLAKHGVDLDVRDKNGYTALHFAVFSKSKACVRVLLEARADCEIVNALGKVPRELSSDFDDLFDAQDADSVWGESESDGEEAAWGDGEEDENVPVKRSLLKRISKRTSMLEGISGKRTPLYTHSSNVSRAATPAPLERTDEKAAAAESDAVNAKQTASFIEVIQRTLAQFPAPQGMIPNIPQLPLPQLPQLPGIGMPAVPWGVLPQIPMVFPVFVPIMPGWPSFLGGEHQIGDGDKEEGDGVTEGMGANAIRTAQEWRATWEKWVALAVAGTVRQQTDDMPPPIYTPRATEESVVTAPGVDAPEGNEEPNNITRQPLASGIRPVGYDMAASMSSQEVDNFAYRPKLQKKQDKMLLVFWLPILLISLICALHSGVQFIFQSLKTALPLKTPLL